MTKEEIQSKIDRLGFKNNGEVAKFLGVTEQHLSKVINGHRKPDSIMRLINLYEENQRLKKEIKARSGDGDTETVTLYQFVEGIVRNVIASKNK